MKIFKGLVYYLIAIYIYCMHSVQRVNRTFRLKVRTDIPLTQKLSLSTHLGTQRRQSNELHANQMKRIVLMMLQVGNA